MTLFTVALVLVAWRVAGRGVAIFTLVSLVVLDLIHVWPETMTTLAMVLTAVVFCALAGIPVVILAARSHGFAAALRPVPDILQTIPPYVYLVPIVMLLGVGMVPGIVAHIHFALPPVIPPPHHHIPTMPGQHVEAAYPPG